MESLVLEEAFPTWKMLDELVDSLLKPGAIDRNAIQTLANMVMSKEFSRTFIYNKEAGINFQAYEDIVDKYRSFTTWLLGQFFYFLSCDDDELIVNAQLSIIDQLSRTQVHIYASLAREYCKAILILCDFLKNADKPIKLNVFEPKKNEELSKKLSLKRATIELTSEKICLNLIKKILRIVKFVLVESISFYSVDISTFEVLDNLLFLLCRGQFECIIFEIFIDLLQRLNCNIHDWNSQILLKFKSFFSFFEQFVYEYYNNQNPKNVDNVKFEDLLFNYLEACDSLKADIGQNNARISVFLLKHSLTNNNSEESYMPPRKVQIVCIKHFTENVSDIDSVRNNVVTIISHNDPVIFCLLKSHIFNDICMYFETHSHTTTLDVVETSETWKLFCYTLNSMWGELKCDQNICQMQKRIEFCLEMFSALLDLKIKFSRHYKNSNCILYFFNGNIVIPKVLSNIAKHYKSCRNLINPVNGLELLVKHLCISECKNIDIVFHLISCPILVGLYYKSNATLPNNYIGNIEDKAQLKSDISSLYNCFGEDKRLKNIDIMRLLNEFFNWFSSGLVKNLNRTHIDQIEVLHLKILKHLRSSEDSSVLCQVTFSLCNVFL